VNSAKVVRISTIVIAVFMIVYVVCQLFRFDGDNYATQTVYEQTVYESIPVEGILFREETVIPVGKNGIMSCNYSVGEKVSTKTVEADIYALADKILKCDLGAAYAILDDLFFMRVEPIIILSTISSVYVDMYRVLAGRNKNVSISQMAEEFAYGNRTFALENAGFNLKKFDFNKLSLSFKALTKADATLKSFSGDDRVVLEKLVVELSYIAVKGESVD
jgi:DNA polymerase-3 subunit delta